MHNFNPGDKVLCIMGINPEEEGRPKTGKTYTVFKNFDECGCGHRIILEELGPSCFQNWKCLACKEIGGHPAFTGGWSRQRFIKISDSTYKLSKEDHRDLIIEDCLLGHANFFEKT
jgi:hypothetical protein